MIKKIIKFFGIVILVYVLLCLITPFNKTLRNRSIKNQINYLSNILDKGYDDKLQTRFPEGKLFSNCLLALSTIEYFNKNPQSDQKYANIVDHCIKRIQSERALGMFNPNLEPKYGMFYQGWSNLVYSKYAKSDLIKFSTISELVKNKSNEIESNFNQIQSDSLRIINTYVESNWPADNLIGISSIENDNLRNRWIELILSTSKHQSGLIHHAGSQKNTIRGSSTAMITYCLNKSGYSDIEKYNNKFEDIFIDNYLGVQLVKENEDGTNKMDVDSGPVLFGYGASATIMNIKTQASLGKSNAKTTWAAMNLISLPINLFRKKYLILKKEPMLDLFMLWSSTEL
ncbi:hypothetical protein FNH22_18725 [Fulvivirga sp. M361]|uniref:hypothetical protein n=1 Tax=Fulvivirga sp. M361 TaxID=2594266 RepID=UPI00117AFC21|nr:hypothetical protein [Fulvivirga sp. M361]TRX54796.1 hypothetical protein FNH22_18725 [Fulvivirga sp. M361]